MGLTTGTRLGPYEILSALGVGGMGEVYRARDAKLKRDVALKVLPDLVASDPDRLARFHREAEVLAALNHPNIAHIYGFEDSEGTHALVMELVEGPTLADRIAKGPIALNEALPIAAQIAEALEAAHEKGIVHRDLKPANIKVRSDGTVKVLDFGLAKAMDPVASSNAQVTASPTITTPAMMTGVGMILGTAAYMSPEQARGRPLDKRTDIWAFGVVLYEMLAGRRAFQGEELSDVLAAVLRQDMDWTALPATTPEPLRQLLRRCLDRDPKQRLRDIGEARIAIDDAAKAPDRGVAIVAPVVSRTRERIAWGAAAVSALLAAGAIAWALRPVPAPLETRLEIATPATDDVMSFEISPDGRRLVFVASATGGPSQLWLRPLDETSAQPLAGTEGAAYPFWSSDSRSLAFFADNKLKRLDIGSGLPQTLASATAGDRGGSWSVDGVIIFGTTNGPLLRVPATGGTPVAVAKLAQGQTSQRYPHFLPGGRQFLFYARVQNASGDLYLGSLDSPESTRLAAADTSARFVPPNWLLFLRQGTLVAQHVDLARGALTGEPTFVADPVAFDPNFSLGAFSVSSAGSIAYRAPNTALTQFTWFDRSGKAVGTVGPPDTNRLMQPTLSPDGRRVAAYRTVQNNIDLWLFDAARMTKVTFEPTRDLYPVWSPDGSRIAFSKDPKGLLSLYQKSSSGTGPEELLGASSRNNQVPLSWSFDGRFLLYQERAPETGVDVWVLPMDGKQKPYPFLHSKFEERTAQFSPDGHWVAYESDESGRPEIYVQPFPPASGQWTVSTMGGVTPRWRWDGKELYYIAPDAKLMAVAVATTGTAPDMGTPTALFQTRIVNGGASLIGIYWQYDVAPDGRFLINVTTGDSGAAPITVIQNWRPRN